MNMEMHILLELHIKNDKNNKLSIKSSTSLLKIYQNKVVFEKVSDANDNKSCLQENNRSNADNRECEFIRDDFINNEKIESKINKSCL